ncbi:MAG: tetratricopeptide repeat protein [Acetobacteraceae bacterium]
MHRDCNGLVVTTASEAALTAFDRAVAGYVHYRADTGDRLSALLAADPECAMGHCLKGYFAMLGYNRSLLPVARTAAADARRWSAHVTMREQAHIAALEAWVELHPDGAVAIWDDILREYPRDVLAFRLAHFVNFWFGRPDLMLASVRRVEPHWSAALPDWGTLLACRCFALEECGHYAEAEAAGRAAIDRDPTDLWAAHGVAHVLEMQGRRAEGILWIDGLRDNWAEANNLRHHLWWHAAMFHIEHRDTDAALALYDTQFRDLRAWLTLAQPDLYIDVQNAASMLFRLERLGVPVGDRWGELADKAEARIGDCLSAFTLPHWMLALAAAGRLDAAERMIAAMRDFGSADGVIAEQVREWALPVCSAILAAAKGRPAEAVRLMRPALGSMYRLGGSHAQQDALEQVYLDAALRAGLADDVRLILERVAGQRPVPPARRVGYAEAAVAQNFH